MGAIALGLLSFASPAHADKTIGAPGEGAGQVDGPQGLATDFETGRVYVADRGNERVSVFEADGTFAFAFGWGVDNGAKEFQTCTSASKCDAGIAGAGAGQFDRPPWIAVDNDPSSPSHHAVYVGTDNRRVQKFDSAGNFISAFGYDVVAFGANDSSNDEEQALTVKATGGTFRLRLEDPYAGENAKETAPLPFNASAAEVAAALNGLATIGGLGGSVAVSGGPGDGAGSSPYTIVFGGNLSGDDVPALGVVGTALTGAGAAIGVEEKNRGGELEVCEGKVGEACKRGSAQPGGECEISRREDPIGVGPGGEVYVGDTYGPLSGTTSRLMRFDPAGKCIGEVELFKGAALSIFSLAVESSGSFYLVIEGAGGALRKYDPSGALLAELDKGTQTVGLAVDEADHLFAQQLGTRLTKPAVTFFLTEYDSSGAVLQRFGYGAIPKNLSGLAAYHGAEGDVYGTGEAGGTILGGFLYLASPPPGLAIFPEPCRANPLGNSKATLLAEINPEGKATTYHFEYITDPDFLANGNSFSGGKPATKTPETPIGSDFELREASAQAELVPETKYHCRVVATNADAPGGVAGPEGTFTSLEPLEIGSTWVSDVGTETARLNATVNPLGISASGYFEYVEEATYLEDVEELGPEHGFDHATKAPDPGEPLDFGAGESFKAGSVDIGGLQPATAYRYRVVATDVKIKPEGKEVVGPTKAFRTFNLDPGALPDGRAYELVSPTNKNSAEVAVPGFAGGLFQDNAIRIQASSGDGEAVTYTSWTSFGKAEGAPGASQYLSRRGAGGWSTENISPFGFQSGALIPPYRGFTPDLEFGAFPVLPPGLAPGCQDGAENLYLRDNETGTLRCLTIAELKRGEALCNLDYAGAAEDGSRVFFAAAGSYAGTGAPEGDGFSLYEWSAEGLRLVSMLPDGNPVAPRKRTHFGAAGEHCGTGLKILHNVVSKDGSKAFWTHDPEEGSKPTQLFVRVDHAETIQLDAKQSGGGSPGNGVFWAASADGSVAYFTSENRLVSGSRAEPGAPALYRFELDKAPGERLTDLTKKGLLVPDVRGVVGASEDGSRVYFVAKAALTGEAEENSAGRHAEQGKHNLYLFNGGTTTFIATLAPGDPLDAGVWSEQPRSLSARVSPDGRDLAFLTVEAQALAGYDNTVAAGQHCQLSTEIDAPFEGGPLCPQAFLYDADSNELACASCNPSGVRPLGPTILPGWSNMNEGPRYLSDNGARLFFETYDALLSRDENPKRDVYEFELEGEGSCDASNPAFDPTSGGCHFLISGGESSNENFLLDASADGRDVFIATRDPLVPWADRNENYDVYDVRAGGGFPEPPPGPPICVGEACKPAPSAPLGVSVPPAFEGPGNPRGAKPCRKGEVRKRGRCARKTARHKAKRHGKANRDRRAAR